MFYFDPGSECRSSSVTGFLSPLFPNVSLTEDEADLPSDKMENAEAPYEAPAPRLVAAAWRKTSVVWQIRNSYVTAASDTDLHSHRFVTSDAYWSDRLRALSE